MYDAGGNITQKCEYAYTTGDLLNVTVLDTIAYGYTDANWPDLLTSYDGQEITSDGVGNMLNDGTWTYTWARMNFGTTQLEFDYNADGLRTIKTLNTDTVTELSTVYRYDGTNLTHMIWDETDYIHFYYDGNGQRVVMDYNGADYFYIYNAQGDVVALADKDGNVVVEYTYDAWGKPLSVTGSLAATVGQINPFRYRGYYYDTETGLYYLQSRYYNPEMGRFLSIDVYVSNGQGHVGANSFCYCSNAPVRFYDGNGETTLCITVGGDCTCVFGASICIGIAIDFHGNIALISSHSVPQGQDERTQHIGLIDASLGAAVQITSDETVADLAGPGIYAGVSGGIEASFGFEMVASGLTVKEVVKGTHKKDFNGFQFTIGYGVGLDFHYKQTHTNILIISNRGKLK